jgi:DNA mismatch repair protein MutL
MNRIRLLSEQVSNQIAAGEVVERPASVVKELVENALDAGAARITIDIQAGGRSLIRVGDDGLGMSRDDALLCLERHATSKIQKAEDLAAIETMGFRGEALPSIASVSRFTITTRERESTAPEGTQVVVNGGKIVEVRTAGCAPGTIVEVRQLFFNLPARRKFLRSEETERAHIQHYVMLAALAHPRVGFTFLQDGRLVWQLAPAATGESPESNQAALRDRLRTFHGAEISLLAVNFTGEFESPPLAEAPDGALLQEGAPPSRERLHVRGFIGAPGVSRATREDQHLFVNRRPVENRGLNHALLEGYHTALMKGRFPVCCLFLEIDPAEVDVNIHPAKREVKFHREFAVRKIVAAAVRSTLLQYHAASPIAQAAPQAPLVDSSPAGGNPPELPHFLPGPAPLPLEPAAVSRAAAVVPVPGDSRGQTSPGSLGGLARIGTLRPSAPPPSSPAPPPPPATLAPETAPAAGGAVPAAPMPLLAIPLRLIGVVGRLYVLFESDRGLVLLDQHAAHERILFEQMMARMEQGAAPSQRLLLAETVELSPRDAQFLREHLGVLTRLGVGLSEFGERTFLLDALPPFAKASNPRAYALELVDALKAAGAGVNSMRLGEDVVAKTVCRHAVKANDPLAGRELENLISDLRRCQMPYTCPHGRPTLIEMNYRELERKFGRTA